MEFFLVFYWKGWRFYQRFLENSKISFKKNIDMWNNFFFSKFNCLLFVFHFLLCLTFYFQFRLFVLVNKFKNFLCFLFYGLEILSQNFVKSWNTFLKNIDIWNPKFFINSIVSYLFFFYFFIILVIFFSYFTYPNLSKNSEQFCGALLYGL